MNMSDQITIPAAIWEYHDRNHHGSGPIFVEVGGSESGCFGRLRPAVPSEHLNNDYCIVPQWMWMRLGAPSGADDDCWIDLTVQELPIAGSVTLRAREEASLTGSADPVAMLTDALSGSTGLSWSCLSVGAELPLPCGIFDIIDVQSTEGFAVPAACILNCDVRLELVPALDHVETPPPSPPSPFDSGPEPDRTQKEFVPFSGVGRRLCD
jgi:hypothetical protein